MTINLKTPHAKQEAFVNSDARRIIVRAGRRGGKTTGSAIKAVKAFLSGKRVLYAAPTIEQIDRFWNEVCSALRECFDAKIMIKNETLHTIRFTQEGVVALGKTGISVKETRIKAKTAWNAETLRGDYADLLFLEEWQMMDEDAWHVVGVPMMLDNNGQAVFIYTPPSRRAAGTIRAKDPRHASKLYRKAQEDTTGTWETYHFSSYDNPFLDRGALEEIVNEMSFDAYRREILAEDDEEEDNWLVYKAFDEETCLIKRFPIPSTWLVYVGHDFGRSNPAALFFAQDPETGFFYAFHEYRPPPGASTAQHVAEFKRVTAGYNVIRCVGGSHQEEEIRQGYTAHGWVIHEPTIRNVAPQLDRVIGLMQRNKLYIFDDLISYREEIMNCLWELDAQNQITDKVRDEHRYHLCACARYILSEFTPETAQRRSGIRVRATSYF